MAKRSRYYWVTASLLGPGRGTGRTVPSSVGAAGAAAVVVAVVVPLGN